MAEPKLWSPEWWVVRMHDALSKRKPIVQRRSAYYEGRQQLAFATDKFRDAFGSLFKAFSDNWCALVVDAVDERLNVQGFRIPNAEADDAAASDRDAWSIWQRNGLDLGSQLCHVEALVQGTAYTLVQPDGDGQPVITVESAEQCIVATEPESGARIAGYKEWLDEWSGFLLCTLYLPDGVWKFVSDQPVKGYVDTGQAPTVRWKPREIKGERFGLSNPLGVVPLVPFENRPRMLHPGKSEIDEVIPVQDAVNKLCADMLVAAEFQAYRQRVLMGVEVPRDPVTNQPIDVLKHAANRLWMIENPAAHAFEFSGVDLGIFVKAIEMFVSHIASQTRTPPHYFERPGGQFPSGESIKSAETGLVAKARRKMRSFEESHEATMRLAFAVLGDPRARVMTSETIWADPESRSESQHVDALVKMQTLGVPDPALWERAGFSPQEVERFVAMRDEAATKAPPVQLVMAAPNGQNGSQPPE